MNYMSLMRREMCVLDFPLIILLARKDKDPFISRIKCTSQGKKK